jgi:23S rRNA C2498 (ribose-2'-O)-methylase RlmM
MNLPLNHDAHEELAMVAMQPNGKDVIPAPLATAPLSRAYYKLHQVWQQLLEPRKVELQLQQGAGLDLGSSPGGWTQVLVHCLQLPVVYTIDPAVVAERVTQCENVTHVQQRMEDWEGTDDAVSILVCDASLLWSELLEQVATVLAKCRRWCLPAVLVLTLKLPFRSLGSVQRHVGEIQAKLPKLVQEWSTLIASSTSSKPLQTQNQLLHLFANSVSERTVVVTFQRPDDSAGAIH